MNKQTQENILNYAKEITTLKDFVEAVRKMPGMYIGYLGYRGVLNMFREVFQNSFDELVKGKTGFNTIKVYYNEADPKLFRVEDGGRGIPFEKMVDIFTKDHTGGNYNKQKGQYSSGRHGVGAKVTNALSKHVKVCSYILGKEARMIEFEDGYVSDKGIVEIPCEGKQGSIVEFSPSYEIMGEIDLPVAMVFDLVNSLMPLTPLGSRCEFYGVDKKGKVVEQVIENTDGLNTYLIWKTTSPMIKPITFGTDNGTMKADISFTYDASVLDGKEDLMMFGNYCPITEQSEPVKGFLSGVCKFFKDYMNKIFLGEKSKIDVVDSDVKSGLKAAVTSCHLDPIFTGQAKEVLSNSELYGFVKSLTINTLEQWSKENASDLQKLCKFFKEVAELRIKEDKAKVKLSAKYESSIFNKGFPDKFVFPIGNINDKKIEFEYAIVEGDSALGSAKNSRDKVRQGLMPIRGKISNAFNTPKEKFLNNPEVQGIISITSWGKLLYGKNFDLKNVPWKRIIIMSDADPDGKHIANLVLNLFLLYLPQVVEAGLLYKAMPPLYSTGTGKNIKYFNDKLAFIEFTREMFAKNNTLCHMNGKEFENEEIVELLYRNIDYIYEMDALAKRYSFDPSLLELVLLNLHSNKLRDIIKKQYRFVNLLDMKGIPVVKGEVDDTINTIFLNDKFLSDTKVIYNGLKLNPETSFILNGHKSSLYSVLMAFENSKPNGIQRYKGLGEMNPEQLADSTLHPDSPYRCLKQYTIEDYTAEIARIRYLESNKYALFQDVKVNRFDVMG